jgi:hypothetical protein
MKNMWDYPFLGRDTLISYVVAKTLKKNYAQINQLSGLFTQVINWLE